MYLDKRINQTIIVFPALQRDDAAAAAEVQHLDFGLRLPVKSTDKETAN